MAKAGIVHFITYGVIAALLVTGIWAISQTLHQTDTQSGTTPRLDVIPKPDDSRSTLIWVQALNKTNYESWTNKIMSSLNAYYILDRSKNTVRTSCSYDSPPGPGQFCDVDIRLWDRCNRETYFNYYRSSPCIFLKLETMDGWVPEYYNDSRSLPDDMPKELKDRIESSPPMQRNNVWISCEGETTADKEYSGPITFYPNAGFPGYYFLSKNVDGYLNPLIAVQFLRPKIGIVINIECRAWAKNIKYVKDKGSGFVNFALLVD